MKSASSMLYWKGALRSAWDLTLLNASGLNKAGPVVCECTVLINGGQINHFSLSFSLRYFFSDVSTKAVPWPWVQSPQGTSLGLLSSVLIYFFIPPLF